MDIAGGYDLLVVGAGLAGLVAARHAQRGGASVLLLERTPEPPGWNNSRIASGIFHIGLRDVYAPPGALIDHIMEITGESARLELAQALVEAAPRALQWLQEEGVILEKWSDDDLLAATPPGIPRRGVTWRGLGMDRCLTTLYDAFLTDGGDFWTETQATSLLQSGRRVTGCAVEQGTDSWEVNGAVILADGGFQANPEMVGAHISPAPQRLKLRAAGSATGDGIRMGQAAGAKVINMADFYGHCLHRESMTRDDLWPYPTLDALMAASVVVDGAGRRLLETGNGVHMTNLLARRADPLDAWVVCDHSIWEDVGRRPAPVAPNPMLCELEATVWQAETVPALAAAAGLDPDGLAETVAAHNEMAGMPLASAPFYALPLAPGITHTMGGLLISARAEVLDEAEEVIPGLYAAGATAGGLDGGPRAGYVGGLIQALTFGMIAGEAAAEATG